MVRRLFEGHHEETLSALQTLCIIPQSTHGSAFSLLQSSVSKPYGQDPHPTHKLQKVCQNDAANTLAGGLSDHVLGCRLGALAKPKIAKSLLQLAHAQTAVTIRV